MEVIAYKTDDFVCNKTPLKLVIETSFYAKYFEVVHRKNLPDIVLFYLNEPKSEKDRVWFLNPLIVQKQYLTEQIIQDMKNVFFVTSLALMSFQMQSQVSSSYEISFENAVHHEAEIQVTFKNLKKDPRAIYSRVFFLPLN